MDIIKAHAVNNLCYITAKKMTPKGIIVHSTGANNPNLKRYVDSPEQVGVNAYGNHWNVSKPGGNCVCVHAFIGYDKNHKVRVAEILPLDICCWGVGSGKKGSYNFDPAYIQFEICEDDLKNKEYYDEAFKTAAEYCAYLCNKFGLTSKNIVSHKEAHNLGYGSNHSDPEHWMAKFGHSMSEFRHQVDLLLSAKETVTDDGASAGTRKCPYLVQVISNVTIYAGAGSNTHKVGNITGKGVYTIVEEKTGVGAAKWGKLKSGAGWISLDNIKMI